MTSTTVFEKVAAGEFSAEQGAKLMIESDRQARKPVKPNWMPRYAWIVCLVAMAGLAVGLSAFGIQRDS
jgi:hypothetical protein